MSYVSETEHLGLHSRDQTSNAGGLQGTWGRMPSGLIYQIWYVPLFSLETDLYKRSFVNSVTPIRSWSFAILHPAQDTWACGDLGGVKDWAGRPNIGESLCCTELGLSDTRLQPLDISKEDILFNMCNLHYIIYVYIMIRLYCMLFNI